VYKTATLYQVCVVSGVAAEILTQSPAAVTLALLAVLTSTVLLDVAPFRHVPPNPLDMAQAYPDTAARFVAAGTLLTKSAVQVPAAAPVHF
jgi:hypothetical protein